MERAPAANRLPGDEGGRAMRRRSRGLAAENGAFPSIGRPCSWRRPRSQACGQLIPATAQWDNPTMVVTLDAKRRLTVPAALAPAKPGDYFDAHFDAEEDAIVFRRLSGGENWLAVLKECPVSPDDVPPRRRAPSKRRKL